MEEKSSISGITEKTAVLKGDSDKLDTLMNLSGELVIIRARFTQLVNNLNRELSVFKDIENETDKIRNCVDLVNKSFSHKSGDKTDKALNTITSVLSNINTKVSNAAVLNMIPALEEMTSALGKISSDIQTGVMLARMVPVGNIFTRLKESAAKTAKEKKKYVAVSIEGERTELDKKMAELLTEPLSQLISFVVENNIEDDREIIGKDREATITLSAEHRDNNIWIKIADDGKGIDPEEIKKLALSKGVITSQQADKLSVRDKLNLMFLHNILSDKNAGSFACIDKVKNVVVALNGHIEIDSTVGKNTEFIIKIPLTLAIIKALLVVIGKEAFAFPLESVTEIVDVPVNEIYSVDATDTMKLRGHALSLIQLGTLIGIGKNTDTSKHKKVVVITDKDHKLGIEVDQLIGEEEIVIKPLPDHFAEVKGLSGASILGDGTIALIADPVSVINLSKKKNYK